MTSNFKSIPVIDLSLAKSPATRPKLLQELHHALTTIGFMYIKNHDVPHETITNLKQALPKLFALDATEKDKVALHNSPHFLGYSQVGSETTAGVKDKREQFEFATELPDSWLAEALSLNPEILFSFVSEQHRLKLVHYPASDQKTNIDTDTNNTQGVGPHKDSSGWWTFLLQASPPTVKGLQALNKSGEWIDIPVIEDTFVVNIGQAFEVVTHGVCKATTHRVLSGPVERYSVPFFQGVRGSLTKEEATGTLRDHFAAQKASLEAEEGAGVDSAFLKGRYDTWGESQLRTKIRSHRDVGRRFYGDVFEGYVNDDT
ncbi:Oxoglutarate/iron-dependent dioxygenase [Penicillium sp. DV-2018c]|nr:Oxoglutarate/iron-dependent dioxygenase [Penicillium sp. DV-2018c]